MATVLTKPVTREVEGWCRRGIIGLGGRDDARPLMVTIERPGILTFREKGRRTRFEIGVEQVYYLAIRQEMARREAERRKARKRRGR